MVHLTNKQYAEVRRRYLALEKEGLTKGLRLNFSITLYGGNQPGDVADVRITKLGESDGLLFLTICEASNSDTADEAILGEGYYRKNFYHYVGLLAAFDAAEAFINEYKED